MPTFVLPFPVIDPVLIEIGPLAIRWYALGYIAGILLGWWYARRLVSNETLWAPARPAMTREDIDDFILWITFGIILGGRIGYVLFYNFEVYLQNPLEALKLWQGGMSFHGGFIGSVLAIILFARRRGVRLWSLLDISAICTPFGLFFGRLANFINGELWGRPSDVPWAMVFPGAGPEPRHPSQLYEAALEGIVLFVVLWILAHRFHAFKKPGLIAGTFTAGYGISRFIVEFFRQPDAQIGFLSGGLTMGMLLSLPMIVLGLWCIAGSRRRTL